MFELIQDNPEVTQQDDSAHARLIKEAVDALSPVANGISARLGYAALQDHLTVNADKIRTTLASSNSPVATQLIQKMNDLQSNDWQFRQTTRATLQGAQALHEPWVRRISYTAETPLAYILGVSGDPVKQATVRLSHELGHDDGGLRYPVDPAFKTDQSVMAKRTLATEARAVLIDEHIRQSLGFNSPRPSEFTRALKNGDLGGYIFDRTAKSDRYLKALGREEASRFVSEYVDSTFGPNLVNRNTGKIRPFDITKGYGDLITPLSTDAQFKIWRDQPGAYLERRPEILPEKPSMAGRFSNFGESRLGSSSLRASAAIGALGVMALNNDVFGAFKEGYGAGVGRLGRTATGVAGFEAGAWMGGHLIRQLGVRSAPGKILLALATGGAGAYLAETTIGNSFESMCKRIAGK